MLKSIFETRAVYRLYDSIALRPIEATQVQFQVPDYVKIVPKGDGFFVLVGKETPDEIIIESYIYEEVKINVFEQEEIKYLWLMPKKTVKSKYISVEGECNQVYYAFRESRMKLLKDKVKGSSNIEVYMDYNYRLEGREIVLIFEEQYTISKILDRIDGIYIIEDIDGEYKKIRTTLSVVYKGIADENGLCEILVPDDETYMIIDSEGNRVV